MRGLITERHFDVAERMFPGIRELYQDLVTKPLTFLELVWEYTKLKDRCACDCDDEPRIASGRPSR